MRLIYLDDAIEAIASRDETDGTYNMFSGRQVIDMLKALPSAQPERKKGKWITDNPHSKIYRYACSECKAHHRAIYDFCPSCGADMREGDSE